MSVSQDLSTPQEPALRGNLSLHGNDALLFVRLTNKLNEVYGKPVATAEVLRLAVRCLAEKHNVTL